MLEMLLLLGTGLAGAAAAGLTGITTDPGEEDGAEAIRAHQTDPLADFPDAQSGPLGIMQALIDSIDTQEAEHDDEPGEDTSLAMLSPGFLLDFAGSNDEGPVADPGPMPNLTADPDGDTPDLPNGDTGPFDSGGNTNTETTSQSLESAEEEASQLLSKALLDGSALSVLFAEPDDNAGSEPDAEPVDDNGTADTTPDEETDNEEPDTEVSDDANVDRSEDLPPVINDFQAGEEELLLVLPEGMSPDSTVSILPTGENGNDAAVMVEDAQGSVTAAIVTGAFGLLSAQDIALMMNG